MSLREVEGGDMKEPNVKNYWVILLIMDFQVHLLLKLEEWVSTS
jgi:hypothetical protein